MPSKISTLLIAATLGLGLAGAAVASDADLTKALAGKTLVGGNAEIKVKKNGGLTGKVGKKGDIKIKGAWQIRDGKWCRTLSEPAQFAGTACQAMTLGDGTVTIDSSSGPITYQIK